MQLRPRFIRIPLVGGQQFTQVIGLQNVLDDILQHSVLQRPLGYFWRGASISSMLAGAAIVPVRFALDPVHRSVHQGAAFGTAHQAG
ncbi:MAG: hypothetical protein ACYDGL_00715 [Bellilinea sp.]